MFQKYLFYIYFLSFWLDSQTEQDAEFHLFLRLQKHLRLEKRIAGAFAVYRVKIKKKTIYNFLVFNYTRDQEFYNNFKISLSKVNKGLPFPSVPFTSAQYAYSMKW